MGMLGDFLGIFRASDKAADAANYSIKKGADGLDHLWYSDEEKAEDAAQSDERRVEYTKMALEHIRMTQNESSARSLSRRYLAWSAFGIGIALTLWAMMVRTLAAFFVGDSVIHAEFIEVALFAVTLLKIWWSVILAAATFYFSAALVRSWGKK